jgi:hypothetical protein
VHFYQNTLSAIENPIQSNGLQQHFLADQTRQIERTSMIVAAE